MFSIFSMFIPNQSQIFQHINQQADVDVAKRPLNISTCLPEVSVAKNETLEVRKYDGFAEARNTARSVPRTRRRVICVSHVCCMDLGVLGNREQPKLPVHTLRKTNITMEKDPLKMYFLFNNGDIPFISQFPTVYPTYCLENNEGPVHRNANIDVAMLLAEASLGSAPNFSQ